jgi:colanic acid/amylovoran biosynthesis glycosyltransferase
LKGAIPHDEVIALMRRAWLFALPAVVASDGDRDGIPNVILEALATGLPVVSTRHSGIPEIVVDGISGALVPPADPIALSEAMERLIADPETRVELGRRGRSMVIESFDIVRNAQRLIATWPTDPDHDRSGDFVPPPPFGKGS